MWRALELIARRRIEEAIARGELAGLPGEGKRQRFEDDALIPAEQRMAYRLLESSGFAPEGVDLRRRRGIRSSSSRRRRGCRPASETG